MKYLFGISISITIIVLFVILEKYIFKFKIDRFLIGWICCIGYYQVTTWYDEKLKIKNNDNTKST